MAEARSQIPRRQLVAAAGLALVVVVVVGVVARECEQREATRAPTSPAARGKEPRRRAAQRYEDALAKYGETIRWLERRIVNSGDWTDIEQLGSTYLGRARLTGDYEDYGRARAQLERSFALAPHGSGPFFLRASLNFALHRLAPIEPDIHKVETTLLVSEQVRSLCIGLRADVAFHQGRYDDALHGYREALRLHRDSAGYFRLAQYGARMGDFRQADAMLRTAQRHYHGRSGETLAWYELQHAILIDLERGDWDGALQRFESADGYLSGWWLVDEHRAEALGRKGERRRAIQIYRDVIRRTNNPEYMDAIARLVDEPERSRWVALAERKYESLLRRYPEAAIGHALEHFIEHGDGARAVSLAEQNRDLRPGAEAQILLARAYLKAGRIADAKRAIDTALATPWRTAGLYVTASEIYQRSGDSERAHGYAMRARGINPHAFD